MKLDCKSFNVLIGKTVTFCGFVDSVRQQGNKLAFIVMRYGCDYVQCVYQGLFEPTVMSSIQVTGNVVKDKRSPNGIEIIMESFIVLSDAQTQMVVNPDSGQHQIDLYRHISLRTCKNINIMLCRAKLVKYLRKIFKYQGCTEITPPSFVTTPCEGGSSLFEVKYAPDMKVYLSQSAQFYLEAMVPVVGDCYSISQSFRAEKSHTRRHLTEFTHVEAEYGFMDLSGLIMRIEDLISTTMEKMHVFTINTNYPVIRPYKTPYRRMNYAQYIDALTDNGFFQPDGEPYTVDMDIPEATERAFIDKLNEPVFITHFPAHLKSFYMKYTSPEDIDNDQDLKRIRQPTDSTDLLFPHCGEIVGASCRLTDVDVLIERCKAEGISLKDFEMYLDLRRYGSSMSAGFGLGLERFLMCLLKLDTVKQSVPFPRRIDLVAP